MSAALRDCRLGCNVVWLSTNPQPLKPPCAYFLSIYFLCNDVANMDP